MHVHVHTPYGWQRTPSHQSHLVEASRARLEYVLRSMCVLYIHTVDMYLAYQDLIEHARPTYLELRILSLSSMAVQIPHPLLCI